MKIGELASATGTPVETLRFCEREGLLPEPARTDGNFRIYSSAHAERVSFIRHCRTLDIALDEIRVLLTFKDAPSENCGGLSHCWMSTSAMWPHASANCAHWRNNW